VQHQSAAAEAPLGRPHPTFITSAKSATTVTDRAATSYGSEDRGGHAYDRPARDLDRHYLDHSGGVRNVDGWSSEGQTRAMEILGRSSGARRLRLALLLIIGAGSVLAYIAMAITINGQPPYQPFPGAVAVLQSTSQPRGDVVELVVKSSPSSDPQHPGMEYDVSVCGPHPYRGELAAIGAARLTGVWADLPLSPLASAPVTQAKFAFATLAGQVSYLPAGGESLPDTQLVSFSIANAPPCPPQPATGLPLDDTVLKVTGLAAAPIQHAWTSPFGWWHGPQASQAWPLTGTLAPFGAAEPTDHWSFSFYRTLNGTWVTPAPEYLQVLPYETTLVVPGDNEIFGPEGVPLNWSLDAAQPAPAAAPGEPASFDVNPTLAQPLSWMSASPISPTARLTDRASLATWQNLLVVAGVGMGIGGAMLASFAYEMIEPRTAGPEAARPDDTAAPAEASTAASREEQSADIHGRPNTVAEEPPSSPSSSPIS
jgi:hypothetical protein